MRSTAEIFGVPIDKVTLEKAFNNFKMFMTDDKLSIITTPNTEIVMMANKDKELLEVLKNSNMNIPDGIGLIYASKIHKLEIPERVTGVDFMRKILEYCNDINGSIFILGGKPGVAQKACENIKKRFKNIEIKGFEHGYFNSEEEQIIIEKINKANPDVLFVALGAPRQEKWIYKNRKRLNAKVAIGVGGSVDIWAGTAKRAPVIYQKLGLEWFYRLLKEPWRYKRMTSLPKFILKVILSRDITKLKN
ncbi:WecB/TagA/CpsF family glycosyltransferase [Caminicella sporogenes]|uniref:WecB/TagA/CpsF family glycosyltransferase n=1 Tax=Caminicella sporogenes TaxID=166485 RepID=UPI00254111AD|nr:WecB/TagA/CpsF family glycosyltransferase [Caminicella sporogenes]WIF95312.1 WecB/TagA/CpsF family glycosyltransferase [Caminicella sporogenes]